MPHLVARVQNNFWYALGMILLAVISVLLLLYELLYPNPATAYITLGEKADLAIAYIFLADFFAGLIFAAKLSGRKQYLKQNWLNFVSSIPISGDIARGLRFLRILRATRVARAAYDVKQAVSRIRQ